MDVPWRWVSKWRKNARTYIHRAINQTRQGSPRIEHYLAHVETPVSDFVRLVRSLARFIFVTPSWHVLTSSRSHSSAQWPPVVLVAHFPSLPFLATPSITQSSFLSLSLVLQFPPVISFFLPYKLMQDSPRPLSSRCSVLPTLDDPLARARATRMARIIFI